MYLVGTEEGIIRRCSKAYSSKFLASYAVRRVIAADTPHTAAVAQDVGVLGGVEPRACAGVCVLLDRLERQDLGPRAVGARLLVRSRQLCRRRLLGAILVHRVCCCHHGWNGAQRLPCLCRLHAPQVFVYDLAVDKYEPLCQQQISKKGKLTRISFNPNFPVLLVGDDRGNVVSLKLSPNLRKAMSVRFHFARRTR